MLIASTITYRFFFEDKIQILSWITHPMLYQACMLLFLIEKYFIMLFRCFFYPINSLTVPKNTMNILSIK